MGDGGIGRSSGNIPIRPNNQVRREEPLQPQRPKGVQNRVAQNPAAPEDHLVRDNNAPAGNVQGGGAARGLK